MVGHSLYKLRKLSYYGDDDFNQMEIGKGADFLSKEFKISL